MKVLKETLKFEIPTEREIIEAYERRYRAYNRADARKVKRALRRISIY